jgi:hypothetical protein
VNTARAQKVDLPHFRIFCISLLDLLSTVLTNVGLVPLSVSVHTMLRSSTILFATVIRGLLLSKWPTKLGARGIAFIVGGVTCAGAAGVLNGDATGNQSPSGTCGIGCGVGFVLIGGFTRALQYNFEEKLLDKTGIPPCLLVGLCGMWGCIWYILIIPVSQALSIEDSMDTWQQIKASTQLQILLLTYSVSLFSFNFCVMEVNKQSGAVLKSLVAVLRPAIVWIIQCLAFYVFTQGTIGSAAGSYWWVQLIGLFFLVAGSVMNSSGLVGVVQQCMRSWSSRAAGGAEKEHTEQLLPED